MRPLSAGTEHLASNLCGRVGTTINMLDLRLLGGTFPRAAQAPLGLRGVRPSDCRLFLSLTAMCWSHFLTHLFTLVLQVEALGPERRV
jgi:hypothetical protein